MEEPAPYIDRHLLAKALAIAITVLWRDREQQSPEVQAMQSALRRFDFTEDERERLMADAAVELDRLVHCE